MRIRRQCLSRKFKRCDGLLSGHSRKGFQEFIKRIACFEVVKQVLDGDARADENERAPKDFGIAMDGGRVHFALHD